MGARWAWVWGLGSGVCWSVGLLVCESRVRGLRVAGPSSVDPQFTIDNGCYGYGYGCWPPVFKRRAKYEITSKKQQQQQQQQQQTNKLSSLKSNNNSNNSNLTAQ
ncbi:hypothetical protein AWZ03_012694 [Drosophila navojoa]|uniref:Uncharacterized protein n=1 Tax=Drosophila navojoa TaxID=7232 RepID=A0A484AZ77_DRONA|nr:hypothetical protein AWZ03_012694 [Drosophila navojoa]